LEWGEHPSILVIRRNRMGDMICTLPLVGNLKRHFPKCRITVACDTLGEPIARSCPVVDDVVVLKNGGPFGRWGAIIADARRLQNFDWVIGVKGGFDLKLACLVRWTNAPVRVGFPNSSRRTDLKKAELYYTDVAELPDDPYSEHQIDTQLRLLERMGIPNPTKEFNLNIPLTSLSLADKVLLQPPFTNTEGTHPFILLNVSSTVKVSYTKQDLLKVIKRTLERTNLAIGIVSSPKDAPIGRALASDAGSPRVASLATPNPLDLAAYLRRSSGFITPEGGAAHLSACVGTPTVVLWSEGPFAKWRSQSSKHVFVQPKGPMGKLTFEQIWQAVEDAIMKVEA
jgi:ADP-heptose:LPS heptosyltransferase